MDLSTLLVLNLRNGLTLINITGNMQAGIVGLLLILSVLVPNLVGDVRERLRRREYERGATAPSSAGWALRYIPRRCSRRRSIVSRARTTLRDSKPCGNIFLAAER